MKLYFRSVLQGCGVFVFVFLFCARFCFCEQIVVNKNGVDYHFVACPQTDAFVSQTFPHWEQETFAVFEEVKDPNAIAIDLGAWIGTTAIWLSNNFHHVIAVECDKVSLGWLEKNLDASGCHNVSVCPYAIGPFCEKVLFGPIRNSLNESMSCIKSNKTHSEDYTTRSITFKQLIYDFVYANPDLSTKKISFIKCDIEGGEESIMEDLLHFAYYNQCSVHLSFHLHWWQSKNIESFSWLFDYFENNLSLSGVELCKHLAAHPLDAVFFKPKSDAGVLRKKEIPAVIIAYNQYSFIKNMVKQLEKYTSDITIVDNNSSFEKLLDYYNNDFKYTLIRTGKNHGHMVYTQDFVQNLVGDLYILTDPDLEFNSKLPDHFLDHFIEIQNYFKASRVGFALCIDAEDLRSDIRWGGFTIKDWERQFWERPLVYFPRQELELYAAGIDTTFVLINRRLERDFHIRVAGDYTCKHLPWHKNFRKDFEESEAETYLKNNVSTSWFGTTLDEFSCL